jgi:hypothetical protein
MAMQIFGISNAIFKLYMTEICFSSMELLYLWFFIFSGVSSKTFATCLLVVGMGWIEEIG